MKKYNLIYLLLFLLFCSCETEDVTKPVVDFNVSATTVSVNETVEFEYTGTSAKQVVVYTGDAGHDYTLKTSSNSGFVMNKGLLTYSYKTPGVYNVVVVATNYDKEGNDMVFNTKEITITVEDARTDLKQISLKKDLYTKEQPGKYVDNTILFAVPYKVRYNNRDLAINLSQQRLEIVAYSSSAKILINDQAFSTTTKYDMTQPVNLKIQSDAGDVQEYTLETIRYAVFESFSINGVNGTVTYSDYDFNKIYINIVLPSGTAVTALTPVFASADANSVKVGETEQVSGTSVVDFSNAVTYVLKTWKSGNENLECETEVEVTVTLSL